MVTRRGKRWLARGVGLALVGGAVVFFTATWIQAGSVASDWLEAGPRAPVGTATVVAVASDHVVMDDHGGIDRPGTWGLDHDGGRAVVGAVQLIQGSEVQRELLHLSGALVPGTRVELVPDPWQLEEADRLGFSEQLAEGTDGPLTVWTRSGEEDTWVVFVPDLGAGPEEAFRLAAAVADAGYPVAVAEHRLDAISEDAPARRHGYGYDEWRDVDAILDLALSMGARDFVLVGYGAGGSVVGVSLYESRSVDRVVGVVLDSPMLDLGSAIHEAWSASGIPRWAIGWTKALASMRFGLDLGAIDHVSRVEEWGSPTLVLHGREDGDHPIGVSEAFAIAKGTTALLLTFPGAGAGEAWNVDRGRYESAVIGFIDDHARGPSTHPAVVP